MSDLGWLVTKYRIFGQLWPTKERPMLIQLDRRADGAGGREVKFALQIKPLDEHHTHGELNRADRAAIMQALARAADEIVEVLRRVPVRDPHLPPQPLPPSMQGR